MLAFAGTDGAVPNDNFNNASQPFGVSRQYSQAVALAARADMAVPSGSLAMVGHSLGGGLASIASLTTGNKGYTFNSAGLSPATAARYGVSLSNAPGLVTAYSSSTDLLNLTQYMLPGTPDAAGTRISLGRAGIHDIGSVCQAMGGSC